MKTTLKTVGTALCLAFAFSAEAHAVTRIRADLNSCATVQRTIIRDGSAIVRYPSKRISNYFLYDRYESPQRACPIGERHVPHTVPTKDNAQCVVYNCEPIKPLFPFDDDFPFRPFPRQH